MLTMYSFYDKKSLAYGAPFLCSNDDIARRHATTVLRIGDSVVAEYPDDHQLCAIGTFDFTNGLVTPFDVKVVCEIGSLKE